MSEAVNISNLIPQVGIKSESETTESGEDVTRKILEKQRLERFLATCPAEFRKPINRALIANLSAWDRADLWSGEFPGVWIWSAETGRCKTRMLWRKFGQLHVKHGKTILKSSAQNLCEEYFSFHMDGDPRAFYRWVLKHDVVMIDDADKIDVRDQAKDVRSGRMFRELFDELYANNRPTLVTANKRIDHFEKTLGESAARRMRAVCVEIEF